MTHRSVYQSQSWRQLPRDYCIVEHLLGLSDCAGLIHHHHVNPDDPQSRTVQCCARHHRKLHVALKQLNAQPRWKRCPHIHRSRESRLACERRLNRDLQIAA